MLLFTIFAVLVEVTYVHWCWCCPFLMFSELVLHISKSVAIGAIVMFVGFDDVF